MLGLLVVVVAALASPDLAWAGVFFIALALVWCWPYIRMLIRHLVILRQHR